MEKPELIVYLKANIMRGVPLEKLKKVLVDQGWEETDIEDSVQAVLQPHGQPEPNAAQPQNPFREYESQQPVPFKPVAKPAEQPRAPEKTQPSFSPYQQQRYSRPPGAAYQKPPFQAQQGGFLPKREEHKQSRLVWILIGIAILLIAGAIFIFLVLSKEKASGQQTAGQEALPSVESQSQDIVRTAKNPQDCGASLGCMVTASQSCSPAQVTFTSSIELFGMRTTSTMFMEIQGQSNGKCPLYLQPKKQEVRFSDEMIQTLVANGATLDQIKIQEEKANRMLSFFNDKDGMCVFNSNSDLTQVLEKWNNGSYSGGANCEFSGEGWKCTTYGDLSVAQCRGRMFEQPTQEELAALNITDDSV